MILETKYDLGQTVWIMHNDKITCTTVYGVELFKHKNNPDGTFEKLKYRVDLPGEFNYIDLSEQHLFESEEALIADLKNTVQNV